MCSGEVLIKENKPSFIALMCTQVDLDIERPSKVGGNDRRHVLSGGRTDLTAGPRGNWRDLAADRGVRLLSRRSGGSGLI